MAKLVVSGAQLSCTMGASPGKLTVLPTSQVSGADNPAATVNDHQPNVNIGPFGMCQSPSNPQVAAATAAALGVLTPQPCVPMTMAPWTPPSPSVSIASNPALGASCTCMCTWGGTIQITDPGQTVIDID
jgi:hypothetical protein